MAVLDEIVTLAAQPPLLHRARRERGATDGHLLVASNPATDPETLAASARGPLEYRVEVKTACVVPMSS